MAVDNHIGYAEYEYAKITDAMMPNVKLSYLLRAAEHGCDEAEYEIGKLYYENGQTDEAIKHFEKGAKSDFWIKTRLGLLYCYTLNTKAFAFFATAIALCSKYCTSALVISASFDTNMSAFCQKAFLLSWSFTRSRKFSVSPIYACGFVATSSPNKI